MEYMLRRRDRSFVNKSRKRRTSGNSKVASPDVQRYITRTPV